MAVDTVGYDYYVGHRKVHTGITRSPQVRLMAHNRATRERGRMRIRTPKMSGTQARVWERRQIYRGAPRLPTLVCRQFVEANVLSSAAEERVKGESRDFATVWLLGYEEARNIARAKGLSDELVLHSAQMVADAVLNRYMQRLVESEEVLS